MTMKLVSLTAAAAFGAAVFAAPQPAAAHPALLIPAIIAAGAGGLALGAAASGPRAYAYEPGYVAPGNVYVAPTATCRIVRQPASGGYRRVRICD